MELLLKVLPYLQIGLALVLILSIVMQKSEAGIGSTFGGGDGVLHHTRRGFEKFLFIFTIVNAILFAVSALLPLFVK